MCSHHAHLALYRQHFLLCHHARFRRHVVMLAVAAFTAFACRKRRCCQRAQYKARGMLFALCAQAGVASTRPHHATPQEGDRGCYTSAK